MRTLHTTPLEERSEIHTQGGSFINPVQGISAWRASGWEITHNDITDLRSRCGGGIGILVGDYNGGSVTDNVVSHNRIRGTLHVAEDDCGGYNGSGIVVYADYRWGRLGSTQIAFNRIVKNDVSLVSDNASLVDVVAFELTEATDTPLAAHVIHDNAIGFNDFRGTELQVGALAGGARRRQCHLAQPRREPRAWAAPVRVRSRRLTSAIMGE